MHCVLSKKVITILYPHDLTSEAWFLFPTVAYTYHINQPRTSPGAFFLVEVMTQLAATSRTSLPTEHWSDISHHNPSKTNRQHIIEIDDCNSYLSEAAFLLSALCCLSICHRAAELFVFHNEKNLKAKLLNRNFCSSCQDILVWIKR